MHQVEQCIIDAEGGGRFEITNRVWLNCELTGEGDGAFLEVRLLEAGAGLEVGHLAFVHSSKVRDA